MIGLPTENDKSAMRDVGFTLADEIEEGLIAEPIWRDPLVVGVRAGEANKGWYLAQVIVHQRHIRRLNGCVTAGCTHGEADVRACQRRCIIDPIANHADLAVKRQPFDFAQLVLWKQIALGIVNTRLLGDCLGGMRIVAGQH